MIAKITRGGSAGGLAVYLHGPGAGTEHAVEVDGQRVAGGMVVASNVPGVQVGDRGQARDHQSKTPGFMTPAGSSSLRRPRSAAPKGSGRSARYQGTWSRPTA